MSEAPPPPRAEPARVEQPIAESRLDRSFRHTTRAAQYAALVVFILAALYLILLIAQNTHRVKVSYGFGSSHAPLLWIVVIAGLVGWVLGIATSIMLRRRTRRPR